MDFKFTVRVNVLCVNGIENFVKLQLFFFKIQMQHLFVKRELFDIPFLVNGCNELNHGVTQLLLLQEYVRRDLSGINFCVQQLECLVRLQLAIFPAKPQGGVNHERVIPERDVANVIDVDPDMHIGLLQFGRGMGGVPQQKHDQNNDKFYDFHVCMPFCNFTNFLPKGTMARKIVSGMPGDAELAPVGPQPTQAIASSRHCIQA